MTDNDPAPPITGWELIIGGIIATGLGGLILLNEQAWAPVLSIAFWVAGGLMSTIGTIAVGVAIGLRRADYDRANR